MLMGGGVSAVESRSPGTISSGAFSAPAVARAGEAPIQAEHARASASIDRVGNATTVTIDYGEHSPRVGAGRESSPTYVDPRVQERQKLERSLEGKQEQQQQREIQVLAQRDREVRAHEQAHAAVGGQYAGAPTYQIQRGPDGVGYAVSGEVPISTGKEATPEATLRKAQVVRRAALAPAEPSPQDRNVAAQASRLEAEARLELAQQQQQISERALESQTFAPEVRQEKAAQGAMEALPANQNHSVLVQDEPVSARGSGDGEDLEPPSAASQKLARFAALDRPSLGASLYQTA